MGNKYAAPAFTRPVLRDPHPTRALVVPLAAPVPVKLQLDPSVLVGMDDLTRWPDNGRGLRSVDRGPRRAAGGPKLRRGGKGFESVVIARRARAGGDVGVIARPVRDPQQYVFLFLLRLEVVPCHREFAACEEAGANARPGNRMVGCLVLFHTQAGQLLPVALLRIAAGIVVYFESTCLLQFEEARFLRQQIL